MLIILTTSYYCCGVIIDENKIVVDAAPIVKWMIGQSILVLYDKHKGKITFSR